MNASRTTSGASRGCPRERSGNAAPPGSVRRRSPSANIRLIHPPASTCAVAHRDSGDSFIAGGAGDRLGSTHPAAVPRERVLAVNQLTRHLGAMEGPEGVDHHRQLVGLARTVE